MKIIVKMAVVLGIILVMATPVMALDSIIVQPLFAMEWTCDWDGFCKFWGKQLGKTTGVVGTVAVIVGVGALIICSSRKKT